MVISNREEPPLTPKERIAIWAEIEEGPGDRNPDVVIQEDHGGDVEKYLRTMAKWHGVPIGKRTSRKSIAGNQKLN